MAKTYRELREMNETPVNNASDGNIAGLPPDDPPVHHRKKKSSRRKKFAGCEVFEVDSDRYYKCKRAKTRYERYAKLVGNDEIGEEIRAYGRSNPGKSIIIQDKTTGVMTYLKLGRNDYR